MTNPGSWRDVPMVYCSIERVRWYSVAWRELTVDQVELLTGLLMLAAYAVVAGGALFVWFGAVI